MLFRTTVLVGFVAIAVVSACTAMAATIEFSSGTTSSLPYSEDGLTFTNLPGASPAVIGSVSGNNRLVAGTNFTPIKIRVSSSRPFTLLSLDVVQAYREWRLESSSGAVIPFSGTPRDVNTVLLNGASGWTNLSYFDILHDPAQPNGSINLDNVVFHWTPDFNGDAVVDGVDLDVWKAHLGEENATLSMGDADGSGAVDGSDFLIWQRHFSQQLPAQTSVPEPTGIALVMVAAFGLSLNVRKMGAGAKAMSACSLIAAPWKDYSTLPASSDAAVATRARSASSRSK